jgi:hypothetical protein
VPSVSRWKLETTAQHATPLKARTVGQPAETETARAAAAAKAFHAGQVTETNTAQHATPAKSRLQAAAPAARRAAPKER